MSEWSEWEGIFLPHNASRPAMTVPPRAVASKKFVTEVRDALNLSDDAAPAAADWIADKLQRFGAAHAAPVFDLDGCGPLCSFCGTIWPLCGHHLQSCVIPEDEAQEVAE